MRTCNPPAPYLLTNSLSTKRRWGRQAPAVRASRRGRKCGPLSCPSGAAPLVAPDVRHNRAAAHVQRRVPGPHPNAAGPPDDRRPRPSTPRPRFDSLIASIDRPPRRFQTRHCTTIFAPLSVSKGAPCRRKGSGHWAIAGQRPTLPSVLEFLMVLNEGATRDNAYKLHHSPILVSEHMTMQHVGAREVNKAVTDSHISPFHHLVPFKSRGGNCNDILPYSIALLLVRRARHRVMHLEHLKRIYMNVKWMGNHVCGIGQSPLFRVTHNHRLVVSAVAKLLIIN